MEGDAQTFIEILLEMKLIRVATLVHHDLFTKTFSLPSPHPILSYPMWSFAFIGLLPFVLGHTNAAAREMAA